MNIARVCKRCGENKPIHKFRRHTCGHIYTCKDCVRMYQYRWELSRTPEQQQERRQQLRKASLRHRHKERVERAKDGRARLRFAQGIIAMGRDLGMSNAEIARRAGIRSETITRIDRGTVPQRRTEARLIAFYTTVKGV